jgi:hypothetical protein
MCIDKGCKKYVTETKIYSTSGQTDSQCNSILFINTGSNNVTIDGLTLQPNQSWSVEGNREEINIHTYPFSFSSATGSNLTIIFKRYVG